MASWTTESSKAMWERVKRDPKTYEYPPFPKQGEVEVTAICRHNPIRLTWDCNTSILTIDGKPVRIMHEGGWCYKVRREGIYTSGLFSLPDLAGLMYNILEECVTCGPLDSSYYDMLLRAKKICTRAAA